MRLLDTWRKRIALLALSVLLAGLGVFFFLQDLGTATNYAGIGTFFVGVVGLAISTATLAISMPPPKPQTPPEVSGQPASDPEGSPGASKSVHPTVINNMGTIGVLQTRERSRAKVDITYNGQGGRKGRSDEA